MNKRAVGNLGESLACAHLEQKGIVVLERNFRCPAGEIDIIAREKRTLLFIEVKARSSLRYGRPAEAVNRAKQLKILRSAQREKRNFRRLQGMRKNLNTVSAVRWNSVQQA